MWKENACISKKITYLISLALSSKVSILVFALVIGTKRLSWICCGKRNTVVIFGFSQTPTAGLSEIGTSMIIMETILYETLPKERELEFCR